MSGKHRAKVQSANIKLEKLREKRFKTLDEQKDFINTKFPKKGKFKWSWRIIPSVLFRIVIFVVLLRFYFWVFQIFNLQLKLWQSILFIIIFPILLNLLLERFKVQKSDFSIFLKGWFK
jgi:hypothetical protein